MGTRAWDPTPRRKGNGTASGPYPALLPSPRLPQGSHLTFSVKEDGGQGWQGPETRSEAGVLLRLAYMKGRKGRKKNGKARAGRVDA